MKVLITSAEGRTGTTMLQDLVSIKLRLENMGEPIITSSTESAYRKSISLLEKYDGWCCKLFFDDVDTWYNPEEVINLIKPDLIINSYREDTFDQFLSWQTSYHNNKWNSKVKLAYKKYTIEDVDNVVKIFHSVLRNYHQTMLKFSKDFHVINISYEEIIKNEMIYLGLDSSEYLNSSDGMTKQNSKEEKIALVNNINEVMAYWKKYV